MLAMEGMMMVETRAVMQLSDILGIGFECIHCGASYLVPFGILDRELPRKCPHCQEALFSDTAPVNNLAYSDQRVLGAFVDYLKELRSRSFGSSVRLEITQPERKAGA